MPLPNKPDPNRGQKPTVMNQYQQPLGSPIDKTNTPLDKKNPWQFGRQQKIATKQIKASKVNIKNPFQLSQQATAQGAIGNGTTLTFTTTLTPQAPHANEINYAIPYVAIYWNKAGVGSNQIWPNQGNAIPGTAFTVQAGYDWQLWSAQIPGTVISSFSGAITDNSMGNGTIQLVTQWEYINLNSGTNAVTG